MSSNDDILPYEETNHDLEIAWRGSGWWVEDTAYRAPIAGPFKTREAAARKLTERLGAIAQMRVA
jgi:hypothetical protein